MLGKLLFRLRCRRRRLAIVRLFAVMGPPVDDKKFFIPTVAYCAAWQALADLEKALYGDQIAYPTRKGQ